MFDLFKRKNHTVRLDAIDHPVLGRLEPNGILPNTLYGFLTANGSRIELSVNPDGGSLEGALKLAVDAQTMLNQLDARCKALITVDSLSGYNSGWRFGEIPQVDGALKAFEKPKLTEAQFASLIVLSALEITGSNLLTFGYSAGDMFWGHSFSRRPSTA